MNDNPILRNFQQRLMGASSVAAMLPLLDEVVAKAASAELTPGQAMDVEHLGFHILKEMTQDDPRLGRHILVERLLPKCLSTPSGDDSMLQARQSLLRGLLTEWMEQYPEPSRRQIRAEILGIAKHTLQGDDPAPACHTMSAIGYRSEEILQPLWALVHHGGDIGDTALATIAALGIPPETRKTITTVLRSRFQLPPTHSLLFTLQQIADRETLDLVEQIIRQGSTTSKGINTFRELGLSLLARIADIHWQDHRLHDDIWSLLSTLATQWPAELRWTIYLNGHLVSSCNSSQVVPSLLGWLMDRELQHPQHGRNVLYARLEECVLPLQLLGWKDGASPESLAALRRDACANTGEVGQWATTSTRTKESAWNTALCIGADESLGWVENALKGEQNGHVVHAVLTTAACCRGVQMSEAVAHLITEECDIDPAVGGADLVARLGGIRLAQSTATLEAFSLLCNFGFTIKGNVLLAICEAIGDVAEVLVKGGNEDVIPKLFGIALAEGVPKRHRVAAIAAIRQLARSRLVGPQWIDTILRLARTADLDWYAKAHTVEMLGCMPTEVITEDVEGFLRNTVLRNENAEVVWRAVAVLAEHGLLHIDSDPTVADRLGLVRTESVFKIAAARKYTAWQAHVVGLLSERYPGALEPAIVALLEEGDTSAIWNVMPHVVRNETQRRSLNGSNIENALVRRIGKEVGPDSVDTELFAALAQISSFRLITEPWNDAWEQWHPEAKVALADAIGALKISEPLQLVRTVSVLTVLTGDGMYAVRRAAYRALSSVDMDALRRLCLQWAESEFVEMRKRAAEMLAWCSTAASPEVNTEIAEQLLADSEPTVRHLAKQSLGDHRRMHLAATYLERVERVMGENDAEVLNAYCYGQALTRVGDDSTRDTLQKHLANTELPPNIRYWIGKLIRAIDDRWRDVTRKWPEPWFGWEGKIEELDGEIADHQGRSLKVHLSLWYEPQRHPTHFGQWGGAASPRNMDRSMFMSMPPEVDLFIPGRLPAKAIVVRHELGRVMLLTGNGPYPALTDT